VEARHAIHREHGTAAYLGRTRHRDLRFLNGWKPEARSSSEGHLSRTLAASCSGDTRPEFEALGDALPYFAGYFLLTAMHNPSATAVMGLARLRVHALAAFATLAVTTGLLLMLTDPMGFTGVPVAMAGGQLAGYAVRFGFIWSLGFRLSTRSWVLHAVALALFVAAFVLRDAAFAVRALALLGAGGVLLVFVPGLLRQVRAEQETLA
jgi:uncharacterized membrane protein